MRESEIVALDVQDVVKEGTLKPKRTLQLRVFKRSGRDADPKNQRVPMPDGTYFKLEKYLKVTKLHTGPLFRSRKKGARLSARAVRGMFQRWQKRAGFDQPAAFHHLRHTAVTNIYRETKDVRIAQRFARHANLQTTTIYAHVSDEDVLRASKRLAS